MNVGGWYNSYYSSVDFSLDKPWYRGARRLMERHGVRTEALRVLEVGCGKGEFVGSLNSPGIFGSDLSTQAIRLARQRAPHCRFLCSKGEHLPFRDGSFDLIVMCEVIEHVNEPNQVLREIWRILSPDGHFIISYPNYLNLPYLLIFGLSVLFSRPKWIDRQVVDRITFHPFMLRSLRRHAFLRVEQTGTSYGHRVVPGLRWINRVENFWNKLRLTPLSFHPVVLLKKAPQRAGE
jgi:ubiquinone/menaquinone biosynthesis C-methylase UbiE